MQLRRKILTGLAALVTITGLGIFAFAGPAQATPATMMCDSSGGFVLYCMNNQGGSSANGTAIIGYTYGDANDYWQATLQSSECGDGYVHTSPACPFVNGSGLNSRYAGMSIYKFYGPNTGKCVTANSSLTAVEVEPCSSSGTVYVWSTSLYVVNVYASNTDYNNGFGANRPVFLNGVYSRSEQLGLSFSGNAGVDQWSCSGASC